MSLQHIQKNSPGLLPKPAKFEKNPPNGYRVIRKTKCGAGGAGSSPIHKQASLAGRLINQRRFRAITDTIRVSKLSISATYQKSNTFHSNGKTLTTLTLGKNVKTS